MRYFNTSQKVKIGEDIVKRAQDFAHNVIDTVDYSDSNQSNVQKIKNDHFISKIGEEAACIIFEKFCKVKGPDYTIYPGKRKSWDYDLIINGIGLGVKTQKKSAALKYGLSWTFQFSDRRKDPILNDKYGWICFVECNDLDGSYECILYPPYQIKELIFKDPKLDYLKNKKKVVYEIDLPNLSGKSEQSL
jgi:hypothetical protein